MDIRIALAGNPNCGKTTLFNALTGSSQFVGNWPGVTVEKKEGKLKDRDGVIITDLPGIYSLSPYTLEEVVARNYLVGERPDAILNLVDGTNIERNLYLTTQLTELGIPVVVAINMMDVVRKRGDSIDINELSKRLGCPIIEISALKEDNIFEAVELAIEAVGNLEIRPMHNFSGTVEHALAHIEEAVIHEMAADRQRWYAVKIFERDARVLEELNIPKETMAHIENDIQSAEAELDDDSESIIANERYVYIANVLRYCYKKKNANKLTATEKIDRIVTNRFLALPIFAVVMFLVYYISVSTVGAWTTDWANDGLFGDGWYFLGIGRGQYEQAVDDYAETIWNDKVLVEIVSGAMSAQITGADEIHGAIADKDFGALEEAYGIYGEKLDAEGFSISEQMDAYIEGAPAPEDYRAWIPGLGVLAERGLESANAPEWLRSLLVDGIIGGVGAVLGFLPQMIVLFIILAFLEACGYMSRIAFVLDRIFRKFGLSGKSFIPLLVGTGCGVPGIMASRTIENERDRKMTIITTTFIPCGAKLPIIALVAGALFDDAWWVAPSAYFIGIAAVIVSGIILKKTRLFEGEVSPFVMELPEYHMPTAKNLFHSVWERSSSFVKKAGTVILLSAIIIWGGSHFGVVDGRFIFSVDMELSNSVLGIIGNALKWLFTPLGFGNIKATVATFMGLVAKEEVVAVFGVLDFDGMGRLAAFSFLIFNLLCAPCFAAMGAIRREMNSAKWTLFAIGYQCVFAYIVSLCMFQLGTFFTALYSGAPILTWNIIGACISAILVVFAGYMLFRKPRKVGGKS